MDDAGRFMKNDGAIARGSFIVTIDGPAGSGKTTVSRLVAEGLGFDYVDTGALYRGVAYTAVNANIGLDDDGALDRLCRSLTIRMVREKDGLHIFVNEADVSGKIRTPDISMAASTVSARPVVRRYLLKLQRDLGRDRQAVFEGRDMGTVVFPHARLKIFLTASPEERAKRRYKQLKEKGIDANLPELVAELEARDKRDSERSAAPLKAADDAVLLDTTEMSIDEVVNQVLRMANQCFGTSVV